MKEWQLHCTKQSSQLHTENLLMLFADHQLCSCSDNRLQNSHSTFTDGKHVTQYLAAQYSVSDTARFFCQFLVNYHNKIIILNWTN